MPLRRLRLNDVIDVLAELFIEHGPPEHIRSDNGPEFVANVVRERLGRLGVTTLYISQGVLGRTAISRASMLACASNCSTARSSTVSMRARVVTGWWRDHYNRVRPHSSLGYRPPAPETIKMPTWPHGSAVLRFPSLARTGGATIEYATGPVIAGSPVAGRALIASWRTPSLLDSELATLHASLYRELHPSGVRLLTRRDRYGCKRSHKTAANIAPCRGRKKPPVEGP